MNFTGFEHPKQNWSKLPHAFINALDKITSLAELKVILYILRHTWGFQEFDKPKRITLDEFQNGRKRRDGSRLDAGVGMSKNAIRDGLKRAVTDGFIFQISDDRDAARNSHEYNLVMVATSDCRGQEVDSLQSEVATRSEKDTTERNKEKRHVASDALADDSDKELPSKEEVIAKGNAELDSFGIQRAPDRPATTTPHWSTQATAESSQWGYESDVFKQQLEQFGVHGRRVQELGSELEARFGLRPNWKKPKKVKGWAGGLHYCLEITEDDIAIVLTVARKMRVDGLTIASPWSLHKTLEARMAENRSGANGAFGRVAI